MFALSKSSNDNHEYEFRLDDQNTLKAYVYSPLGGIGTGNVTVNKVDNNTYTVDFNNSLGNVALLTGDVLKTDPEGLVNTTPFVMGKIALQVTMDVLNGVLPGGWDETPTVVTDKDNALSFLYHPENLYPKPSKEYKCDEAGAAGTSYTPPEGAEAPVPLDILCENKFLAAAIEYY